MTKGCRVAWIAVVCAAVILAFLLPLSIGRAGASAVADVSSAKIFTASCAQPVRGDYVHIGGVPIGISIGADGLIVEGQSGVSSERGEVFPASQSGVVKGDVIVALNGEKINSLYILKRALENADGEVSLTVKRRTQTFQTTITPVEDISGQKRLGLVLKEDIGGVGTLTFVTQDGRFGALGHYIQDAETGLSAELDSGKIYPTEVEGVIKGEIGKAGGLQADVNRLFKPLGVIDRNGLIGIYGDYVADPTGELVRVAQKGEAKMGAAKLLTTVEGSEPELFDIDIVKVISQSEAGEKGMVISVRDKRLLEKTGGIVQGMSGSPILQNGALIGAVTHVFVQDPTRGYAVHSRFMLEYARAEEDSLDKAA